MPGSDSRTWDPLTCQGQGATLSNGIDIILQIPKVFPQYHLTVAQEMDLESQSDGATVGLTKLVKNLPRWQSGEN